MAKILLVDDNKDVLFSISQVILKKTPHEAITAENGYEAIQKAESEAPDLILLDISMAGMDGYETCKKLKENPVTADIPVIFLTATIDDLKKRITGLELGAEDFICQPIDNLEFLARIKVLLRNKEMIDLIKKQKEGLERQVRERTADIRKSEARLAEAQRIAHLGNWDWDIVNNTLRWSDEIYRIFGLTPQEFGATFEAFLNSVHPDDREFVKKSVDEALYEKKTYSIDYRIVLPDGRERVVHEKAEVDFDEEGKPVRMAGTILDITERKRAEKKLRLTQFAIDRAADAVFWMGPDAKFIYVNDMACKNLGYTREESLSMTVHDIDPNFPADKWPEFWDNLKQSGSLTFESRHRTKDGTIFPVEIMTNYLEFEGKEYNCSFARDITDRKRSEANLRASEERFRKIFEEGPLGMTIVGLDCRFIDVNPAICKMLGYTKEELTSLTFSDITRPEDIKTDEKLAERVFKGEIPHYHLEKRYIKKNGETLWIHLTASVIRGQEEKPLYGLAMIKDISKRKHAEEKLHDFAEELEWKNLMLERAKDEAEEATKLKEKFLSLAAHDLKTPMASITGFLEMLYRDTEHPLQEEQKSIFEIILNSANNMVRLIDEVLEVSSFQSGQVTPKPEFMDGHFVAKSVSENLGHLAREKGIDLANEVPPGTRLFADPKLFTRVIQNLVSNAVKFSKKEDHITLFVPPDRKNTMAVKDTGVGIKAEFLPDLFKHDIKTSTHGTAGESGTGLGLPFAHEIMRHHGGTLTVEAGPGRGSVFYAELPYVRPRILIVEDERETRILFKKTLIKIDVDIVEADNGEEALAVLKEKDIHLIIADIRMSVMDGFQMLEQMKKDPQTEAVPIIMVTGEGKESKEKAFHLGANEFITKPINMGNLVQKVRRFVK